MLYNVFWFVYFLIQGAEAGAPVEVGQEVVVDLEAEVQQTVTLEVLDPTVVVVVMW